MHSRSKRALDAIVWGLTVCKQMTLVAQWSEVAGVVASAVLQVLDMMHAALAHQPFPVVLVCNDATASGALAASSIECALSVAPVFRIIVLLIVPHVALLLAKRATLTAFMNLAASCAICRHLDHHWPLLALKMFASGLSLARYFANYLDNYLRINRIGGEKRR